MHQFQPFYMTYQPERYFDEDSMCRRDYEYMKSTYPDTAKRIMPYVEMECDRIEYSGSMMFDEYPDQLQVRMMCRKISGKVRENNEKLWREEWLEELIHVLVWHEIMKRRTEYRKYRRKFY